MRGVKKAHRLGQYPEKDLKNRRERVEKTTYLIIVHSIARSSCITFSQSNMIEVVSVVCQGFLYLLSRKAVRLVTDGLRHKEHGDGEHPRDGANDADRVPPAECIIEEYREGAHTDP